jgi:hypothetical protein
MSARLVASAARGVKVVRIQVKIGLLIGISARMLGWMGWIYRRLDHLVLRSTG